MDRKIRIGAVSYLNTKPLIYGLEEAPIRDEIELVVDYPAHIAAMLADDRIDIGLVPVAIIPELAESHIVTDYCIACDGAVESVAIFSEVPMDEIRTVLLDYQSRTSVMLARILLRDYWKKDILLVDTMGEEFRHQIQGDVAGVVIGDRALRQKKESRYMYDLGQAWKEHTGLPFVFAAWISNKPIPTDFIALFNEANAKGLQQLDLIIARETDPPANLMEYYTKFIKYELTAEKRQGLLHFLSLLKTYNTQVSL
ncbi:MAG TPA: menaquinone biosynthesis protein [Chitinophagaceae bacterium]|nr:menaquinone biosynthesis protein [Chitinophagaceae bacterium]